MSRSSAGTGREQLDLFGRALRIVTPPEGFDEGDHAFLDTAALMQSLDCIVSSDTAVAHLAGALSRPAIVVLKAHPEWRWGQAGTTTMFYPATRLARQTASEAEEEPALPPGTWPSSGGPPGPCAGIVNGGCRPASAAPAESATDRAALLAAGQAAHGRGAHGIAEKIAARAIGDPADTEPRHLAQACTLPVPLRSRPDGPSGAAILISRRCGSAATIPPP